MSSRQVLRSTTIAIVFAALILPTSALAATKTSTDAKGDAPSDVDIRKVKVVHGKKAVRIVIRVHDLRYTADGALYGVTAFVDTRAKRTGPEYAVSVEGFHAYFNTVRRWRLQANDGDDPYGDIRCPLKTSYRPGTNLVTFQVPRSCFGNPKRLRVKAEVEALEGGARDVSPVGRRFHKWVKRG